MSSLAASACETRFNRDTIVGPEFEIGLLRRGLLDEYVTMM